MPDETLPRGARLGAYEILGPLGAGGMGEVYRAWDPRLERQVALKLLPAEMTDDPERLERFRREAKALAAVSHPSIVTIHEVGEAGGTPFLAMELVEGDTLERHIPAGGMDLERFFELAIPLADALATAHDRGVVHRDLKPGNVMVTAEGRVKLLDFGLAKRRPEVPAGRESDLPTATLEALTREGTLLGTAPYMSPEQIQGGSVDARSDVFSLGIVLHEMLTGDRPFAGEDPASLVSSILRDEPTPLPRIRPGLPRHLERIVGLCLEKRPGGRFQSARDVRNQLEQLRREIEAPPEAPPPAPEAAPSEGTPWPGRRILWAAVGSVAFLGGLALWWLGGQERAIRMPAEGRISIAVLPLQNLSGDPEQEYFADGMTEALITELSKIRDLDVISRTSVMRFKGTDETVPQIAETLGVNAVVEGSVLRSGEMVRVRAGLVSARPERQLWSESFDRPLRDVLAVHSEVARAIAREVKGTLEPGEQERLASPDEVDPASYDAYLRARQHWSVRTPQDVRDAIELYELSIRHDPDFAAAWAGLAQAWVVAPKVGLVSAAVAMPRARSSAARALEIEPTSSDAHAALGYVLGLYDRDWEGAEEAFQQALTSNPSNSTARFWYAAILAADGQLVLAVSEARRAEQLDPLAPIISAGVSWMLHFARLHEEAAIQARRTLEIDPDFLFGRVRLGIALELLGRHGEAIEELRRAVEISGDENADVVAALGHAYGAAGRRQEAREVLLELDDLATRAHVPAYARAWVHLALDERDEALEWVTLAVEAREWDVAFLGVEPWADPLRGDPRFESLLETIGAPRSAPHR